MRVLVSYASRMGGTREIAAAVAEVLAGQGLDVDLCPAEEVRDLDGFDAVVLGSALYANRWRPVAKKLLARIARRRPDVRLFLFQTGPLGPGAAAQQVEPPPAIARRADALGAAVVTFGGRLQPDTAVGFIAKKMAIGPNAGDCRDFDRIRSWAGSVAAGLGTAV